MGSSNYAPPWRDVLPDGTLGEEYGPKSAATLSVQMARYQNWAYRKQGPERSEAKQVHEYFAVNHEDVPDSEKSVYRCVYVHRLSLGETADDMGISKSSIKCYLRRLRLRAEKWEKR